MGAAFLVFSAGLAVVLVTRPDLVVPTTLGWSTTAGACFAISTGDDDAGEAGILTVVDDLRGLAVLALGRPTGFLAVVPVVVLFLVVVDLGFSGFSAFSVFFAVAFLGPGLAAAVFYTGQECYEMRTEDKYLSSSRLGSSFLLGQLHGARGT